VYRDAAAPHGDVEIASFLLADALTVFSIA
jgi:hypothetical protein